MEFTVQASARKATDKPKALRRSGFIPAVMYGHDGTNAVSLSIPAKIAENLVQSASVNNSIITVEVPELSLTKKALLRRIQKDAMGSKLLHLNFFAISAQSSLTVTVPIYLQGNAVGVAVNRGHLEQMLNAIELNCKPDAIPEAVEIDITQYDIDSALHVNELTLPEGVAVAGDRDRIVFAITGGSTNATADTEAEADTPPTVVQTAE